VLLALRHPWCAPWTLGLAAAIAYSRVAVGVHFPLDVIAGSALGCLAGWLVHRRGLQWEARREAGRGV
jgi:undecaprenyl-diphosphatase